MHSAEISSFLKLAYLGLQARQALLASFCTTSKARRRRDLTLFHSLFFKVPFEKRLAVNQSFSEELGQQSSFDGAAAATVVATAVLLLRLDYTLLVIQKL